jgi:hypothetical protein
MIFLRFGSLLTMSNKIIYDTNCDVKFVVFFRKPLGAGGRDCAISDSFFEPFGARPQCPDDAATGTLRRN